MITVRRSMGRRCERLGAGEAWLTFDSRNRAVPFADGFGTLALLNEERLLPGAAARFLPPPGSEVVTYVHEGKLAYEDSRRGWTVLQAGDVQRMRGGQSRGEQNASEADWAHIFRIQLKSPGGGRETASDQKRFGATECRGRLCAVATPDSRGGSLRIRQNVSLYLALLDSGHHVVHELVQGRGAWMHVISGKVRLGEIVLAVGDGAGVTGESAVSLTALEPASVLLVDVGELQGQAAVPSGELSGADLFKRLWEALADILGPVATATLVNRSARTALARSPELAEFAVTRVDGEFGYVLPRSFDEAAGGLAPLGEFLDELKKPLVQLTGQVVLRHLRRIPELQTGGAPPPPRGGLAA